MCGCVCEHVWEGEGFHIADCSGPANVDTSGNLFARRKSSCNIEMKRG